MLKFVLTLLFISWVIGNTVLIGMALNEYNKIKKK